MVLVGHDHEVAVPQRLGVRVHLAVLQAQDLLDGLDLGVACRGRGRGGGGGLERSTGDTHLAEVGPWCVKKCVWGGGVGDGGRCSRQIRFHPPGARTCDLGGAGVAHVEQLAAEGEDAEAVAPHDRQPRHCQGLGRVTLREDQGAVLRAAATGVVGVVQLGDAWGTEGWGGGGGMEQTLSAVAALRSAAGWLPQ